MARNPLFRNVLAALSKNVSDTETRQHPGKQTRRKFLKHSAVLMGGAMSINSTTAWSLAGGFNKKNASTLNVAVVGAGLAGLSCAYELRKRGVIANVFEASNRTGGRCYSMNKQFPGPLVVGNQTIERGGEFIDTTHSSMLHYVREFGLTLEDTVKIPGDIKYYFNGQHYSESDIVNEFREFFPAMKKDLRNLGTPTADSFTDFDRQIDLMSLAEYLDSRKAGPLLRRVLDVIYNIEYGLETHEQSALNFLLFMHADRRSRFKPLGVFTDERYHIVEGNQAIASGLEERLAEAVNFEHRLLKVSKLSDGRVELIFDVSGNVITTYHDALVLTLPFSVLRDVELDPSLELPDWKTQAINELRYGNNAKLMIAFDERPWLNQGGNAETYSDLANHQCTWETNIALATNQHSILTDYSGGNRAANLDTTNVQHEANLALNDFDKIFPGANAFAKRDASGDLMVHLEHWLTNPNSKGSYTANHPGYFTSIAGNEGKTVDNIFFAGEHANSFYDWQGYMEGAILSGKQAAKEIVSQK